MIIGRNEGTRLETCLRSVKARVGSLVYVDSGSTDGSRALARSLGVPVVELTSDRPFTAARARNAGANWLAKNHARTEFVQFIDGDCELDPSWIAAAVASMLPEVAVVCGRRRERYPQDSVYNRLCDMEWNTPVGEAEACGGDALMRLAAYQAVGGFTPELIGGEEPDLCHRLRLAGWKVLRIDAEMTRHDAAITRMGEWWKRNQRSGYVTAEALQRRGDLRLRRQVISNLVWAMPPAWLLWPALWFKVCRRSGALYATHITLGKLPHCHGQLRYWLDRLRARPGVLIEYK